MLLIQDYNATIITPLIINYSGLLSIKTGKVIEYDGEGEIETKLLILRKAHANLR